MLRNETFTGWRMVWHAVELISNNLIDCYEEEIRRRQHHGPSFCNDSFYECFSAALGWRELVSRAGAHAAASRMSLSRSVNSAIPRAAQIRCTLRGKGVAVSDAPPSSSARRRWAAMSRSIPSIGVAPDSTSARLARLQSSL